MVTQTFSRTDKNISNFENLNETQKQFLIRTHAEKINKLFYNRINPSFISDETRLDTSNETNIKRATSALFENLSNDHIDEATIDFNKHLDLLCFYYYAEDLIQNIEINEKPIIVCDSFSEALVKYMKEGKIVNVLESAKNVYADILKLEDKYSIRLSDGKYAIASGNVKVSMIDPGENPGWAIWFLEAVPVSFVPNKAELLFLEEDERKSLYPSPLKDNMIICHASLWDLGTSSSLLLHTAWGHVSASYKWKINKPIEVASILFRAVSHPCHLFRNFGYSPQMVIPAGQWF